MAELLNIFLNNDILANSYKSKQLRIEHKYPIRENAQQHGERLLREYTQAKALAQTYSSEQVAAIKTKNGCYFDISGLKGKELVVKSLEAVSSGIRICNVRVAGEKENAEITATVYIPDSKENIFVSKLEKYAEGTQGYKQKPAHDNLVKSIEAIKASVVKSLWTDRSELFPHEVASWCEVWLRIQQNNSTAMRDEFSALCHKLEIPIKNEFLIFPDRMVCAAFVSDKELGKILQYCDYLAEFRRVAELNSFFMDLAPSEQKAWADEMLTRIKIDKGDVSVCILDTGVNDSHPLLKPFYEENSVLKARDYMISGADMNGHGTQMAGIAGYGDLRENLADGKSVTIQHSLESVKIIGNKKNEPELYGEYTKQAVSIVEIANPTKQRALCLAVTAIPTANKDGGRPSSWSAAIDAIASGTDTDDGSKRLVLVSAGNVCLHEYNELKQRYPDASILHEIEDPGQSWNALTVGAATNRINIDSPYHDGYTPLASAGALSPYSSTSRLWSSKWPIKPEILCEGGNAATNEEGTVDSCDNLSILTTHYRPTERLFTTTNATSAAVANASWMASQIMNRYPNCWPETVRALMIASASWSDVMYNMFCNDDTKKKDVQMLLRTCGYGIASLEKAQFSAENAVNMIIEAELQPYEKRDGYCGFGQMHLHQLPWPRDYLLGMGAADVELKVVLSYFVEPGPGDIGFNDRYRYPSCGLRFDVNNVSESRERFERRINQQMQNEENDSVVDLAENDTDRWLVGVKGRTTGSLHCDIWKGTAAELSESNLIAIYPTTGWWRTRGYLNRQDSKIRYSLVVTLSTPQMEAKIYTEIVNQIKIPVEIRNRKVSRQE